MGQVTLCSVTRCPVLCPLGAAIISCCPGRRPCLSRQAHPKCFRVISRLHPLQTGGAVWQHLPPAAGAFWYAMSPAVCKDMASCPLQSMGAARSSHARVVWTTKGTMHPVRLIVCLRMRLLWWRRLLWACCAREDTEMCVAQVAVGLSLSPTRASKKDARRLPPRTLASRADPTLSHVPQ